MIIEKVHARKILDSRGEETIEVSVNDGPVASAPNGKSIGRFETKPYRKDIDWCIKFLNAWDLKMEIKRFNDLFNFERILKREMNWNSARDMGANALFAFECAILKALAHEEGKPLWEIVNIDAIKLPHPVGNVVGGGLHSLKSAIHPDFQEFLVIPHTEKFSKDTEILDEFYKEIGKELKGKERNDEGAWLVQNDNEEILDLMNTLRRKLEKKHGAKIGIGLDAAASTLWKQDRYMYNSRNLNASGQLKYMDEIIKSFGLSYLEDPLEQRDSKRFEHLVEKGNDCLIVGDDLVATQIERLERLIRFKAINATIVKPNQNGSLLEVRKIFDICKKKGIKTVMSHRSGETMDTALADLAFAFGADYIKCGVKGKEREAKLKRMIEIEKSMNEKEFK